MDRDEAKLRFQDADRLFKRKEFDAALRILMELNAEFPDERHILYPMARCLTGLKRYPEAREIAAQLVKRFRFSPAQELTDRIDRMQTFDYPDVQTPTLPSGLNSILDTPASISAGSGPPPLPRSDSAGSDWKPYAVWIGLTVASYLLLILVGRAFGPAVAEWRQEVAHVGESGQGEIPAIPIQAFALVGVMNLVFGYFLACFPSLWSLKIVGALRYDDFGENIKDVAVITLIGIALGFVFVLGWIIFLVILKKRYDLSFGQLLGAVVVFFVLDILISIPPTLVYSLVTT